ncbi:hypothetical protein COLO4_37471 [Corchorus olitorius]|uniref:Uncharacterized protein n=1 Tax=Corchorus olitorius TaxID=93759 RepID=A0A1R3G1D3_9ROSI|nr:hypothetical protein COLO4_37471 [Corchorus olitorius]
MPIHEPAASMAPSAQFLHLDLVPTSDELKASSFQGEIA